MRAATSMFLISLAKSLPRLASMPAFLCLVVAHLEWPPEFSSLTLVGRMSGRAVVFLGELASSFTAITLVPGDAGSLGQVAADDVHEQRMHPAVPGQFGVEAGGHHVSLADGDDLTVGRAAHDAAEHLDLRTKRPRPTGPG